VLLAVLLAVLALLVELLSVVLSTPLTVLSNNFLPAAFSARRVVIFCDRQTNCLG